MDGHHLGDGNDSWLSSVVGGGDGPFGSGGKGGGPLGTLLVILLVFGVPILVVLLLAD
ncbi:hypothetical protein [Kitasatospora sp. NPDC005856]|uniref:hypothetical protein n=1 Tax=Kitasatospora sp. NPDC005856 TaxID=3154566 RepID=UPI0033FDFCEC